MSELLLTGTEHGFWIAEIPRAHKQRACLHFMSWEEDECLYGWIFRACCCSCCSMLTSQSDYYSNRANVRHGLQQAGGSKHITFPAISAEEEEQQQLQQHRTTSGGCPGFLLHNRFNDPHKTSQEPWWCSREREKEILRLLACSREIFADCDDGGGGGTAATRPTEWKPKGHFCGVATRDKRLFKWTFLALSDKRPLLWGCNERQKTL